MDAQGFAVLLRRRRSNCVRSALLEDPRVQADYAREMRLYLRQYRNHPSIMAWAVGMNPYGTNKLPPTMGQRAPEGPSQPRFMNAACDAVRRVDPTRLVYCHCGGGTGDFEAPNLYLNFVPLQEREEWPSAWAASGQMPYSAIEFGEPYTANFWKGKRFLLTEYAAMYFGDQAYAQEGETGLKRTLEYGLLNVSGNTDAENVNLKDFPIYWDFQRLFVRDTNRAWRTWGLNGGWLYWCPDTGYGDPPAWVAAHGYILSRYSYLTAPVTEKPAWANPNFDIHSQDNQSLLVYLAGAPIFTDKTHAYYAGETIQKQIAALWDGPGTRTLQAAWTLGAEGGVPLASGTVPVALSTGDIKLLPISMTAPAVTARTPLVLTLTVTDGGKAVATDSFDLQIFPRLQPQAIPGRVALYDPTGKSAWVKTLDAKVDAVEGRGLAGGGGPADPGARGAVGRGDPALHGGGPGPRPARAHPRAAAASVGGPGPALD